MNLHLCKKILKTWLCCCCLIFLAGCNNEMVQNDIASSLAHDYSHDRENIDAMRWFTAYDFADRIQDADRINARHAVAQTNSANNTPRSAIFQHPDLPDEPISTLQFQQIELPVPEHGEHLLFHGYIAISDHINLAEMQPFDGCRFIITLNEEIIFDEVHTDQVWREWYFELDDYAGQAIDIRFAVDPRENNVADWALWGRPRILIEGREASMRSGPQIELLKTDNLMTTPMQERVLEQHLMPYGSLTVALMDRHLDMPALLRDSADAAGPAPVPLPPRLVVGEGPSPQNHTLIRVLNHHHIAEYQFLAYSPEVRGGVQVHAISLPNRVQGILAAPLLDADTREIRIFDTKGIPIRHFTPEDMVLPPYEIVVGQFLDDVSEDIIVLASRHVPPNAVHTQLHFYTSEGVLLKTEAVNIPEPTPTSTQLRLGKSSGEVNDTYQVQFLSDLPSVPSLEDPYYVGERWHDNAFDKVSPWVTKEDEARSLVTVWSSAPSGNDSILDLGARENRFYYQYHHWEQHPEEIPEDGEHIKYSLFAHIRTDISSPGWSTAGLERDVDESTTWVNDDFLAAARERVGRYHADPPTFWELCFTHRQGYGGFDPWAAYVDPETGMHRYSMLTRNNNPATYHEFDFSHFHASTYAFEIPELENLYILPLRAYLRELANVFKENPEHIVVVEPNHEHEIAVDAEGTNGDYNPRMISGFFDYLRHQYGLEADQLAERLGYTSGDFFDAPRNWERGDWDAYNEQNLFYNEWIAYQRYVVNRRLAQTFREALLAGFPPELIKSHQIPDTYAIGNLDAFSTVISRYTPIDYAKNVGVGYGFTRYSVWYEDRHNVMQGAHSSGFDQVVLGEYQALHPDNDVAYNQLRYIFDHGGYAVHCMTWPESYDNGFNASMEHALRRLVVEDPRNPNQTGGVGQIKPFISDTDRYNIAQIGTGHHHTGLLKSLNADGTWEGSVYVVPFHAHVAISTIAMHETDPNAYMSDVLPTLDSGCQLDIQFIAGAGAGASAFLEILREGVVLPGLSMVIPLPVEQQHHRVYFRTQVPVDDITVRLRFDGDQIDFDDTSFEVYLQEEQTVKLALNRLEGIRHQGGVTFDILPETE